MLLKEWESALKQQCLALSQWVLALGWTDRLELTYIMVQCIVWTSSHHHQGGSISEVYCKLVTGLREFESVLTIVIRWQDCVAGTYPTHFAAPNHDLGEMA